MGSCLSGRRYIPPQETPQPPQLPSEERQAPTPKATHTRPATKTTSQLYISISTHATAQNLIELHELDHIGRIHRHRRPHSPENCLSSLRPTIMSTNNSQKQQLTADDPTPSISTTAAVPVKDSFVVLLYPTTTTSSRVLPSLRTTS